MAENSTTDNGRRSIGSGRAWLVPLAGVCLPFTSFLPPRFEAPARIAIGLAAVVAWVGLTTHRSAPPRTIALLAASDERRRGNTWQLALLGVVAAATTAYLITAMRVTVITTNDGAYYYGVARHIATTGRFEEPIVWHFLNPPETIVHVPFDYWGPLTSLLLLPSLALFGAAPTTAFLTMAVFSAATLLAFWYFVCIALPLRYYTTQLLALLLFAFSPALDRFRFQPESTVIAQLFLLVALVAFCQRRLAFAVLGGFGILLTRADGAVLFTLIGAAALAQAWGAAHDNRRAVRRVAGIALTCVVAYALWSYASFGTLTPPAAGRVPFLYRYWDVYRYDAIRTRTWDQVIGVFTSAEVVKRLWLAFETLRAVPFTPYPTAWLGLCVVAAASLARRGSSPQRLILILAFVGYFGVAFAGGPGFATVRTPHTFAPLIILAGSLGIDAILTRLQAWVERGQRMRTKAILAGAAIAAASGMLLGRLPALQNVNRVMGLPFQLELTKLDPVLGGEAVASNMPFYLIAYTRSPAVSLPKNGEAAIEAVLERYQVRWVVVGRLASGGASSTVLKKLLRGNDRANVGRFRLQLFPVEGSLPVVYRVDPPD